MSTHVIDLLLTRHISTYMISLLERRLIDWSFKVCIFDYRNLSYETEEDTLSDVMSEFGHVNYCRIVVDPKTEHSKGV